MPSSATSFFYKDKKLNEYFYCESIADRCRRPEAYLSPLRVDKSGPLLFATLGCLKKCHRVLEPELRLRHVCHPAHRGTCVKLLSPPRTASKSYFFFLSGRWLSAEPAADFESLPVLLSRSTFEADVPAFFPVCSFFAMLFPL